MPIISILDNKKSNHSSFGDEKGSSRRKEKRCYFGFMSLRTGVITCSAISFVLSASCVAMMTTREERNKFPALVRYVDFFIPFPYMDQKGTSFVTVCQSLAPLVGLYGAYHKSYKMINLYKKISFVDLVWGFVSIELVTFTTFPAVLEKLSNEDGLPRSYHKYIWLIYLSFTLSISLAETYNLYITSQYEKSLLKQAEEETE